ncbi:hypothetical protein GX420_03265 [bacterium]|nr:hypothetical protein [bacterium]
MYCVSYNYKLRKGRSVEEFKVWLDSVMPLLENICGVKYHYVFQLLEPEDEIIHVVYFMEDIKKWREETNSLYIKEFVQDLNLITNLPSTETKYFQEV